jgi:hypothetical protein
MNAILISIAFLVVVGILVRFLSGDWRRVLQVVGGWSLYQSFGWIYDYLFWGFMVLCLGELWGSVICSVGAFVINFFLLRWYQKRGNDWLGVNILENIKDRGHVLAEKLCNHQKWYVKWTSYPLAKLFQLILWCLKRNDFLAFLILSIWQDSFVTTNFLRHGRFGELEKKDYFILIASTIVSVISWSIGVIVFIRITKLMFG